VYNPEITAVEIMVIDLHLYGEHRPEERFTGSKTDLDLSAESTYMRVYTVEVVGMVGIIMGTIVI